MSESNQELIFLYFRIGKIISENQKYGSNFINSLSTSLIIDFPNATGFSPRNLARMKKFYETYGNFSNLPTALAKLPWSLKSSLAPIGVASYEIRDYLPSEEEINKYLS